MWVYRRDIVKILVVVTFRWLHPGSVRAVHDPAIVGCGTSMVTTEDPAIHGKVYEQREALLREDPMLYLKISDAKKRAPLPVDGNSLPAGTGIASTSVEPHLMRCGDATKLLAKERYIFPCAAERPYDTETVDSAAHPPG